MIDPAVFTACVAVATSLTAASIAVHRADKLRRFWRNEALAQEKNARDALDKADAAAATRDMAIDRLDAATSRYIRAENLISREHAQRLANLEKGRRTQAERRSAATGTKSATFAGLKNGAAA